MLQDLANQIAQIQTSLLKNNLNLSRLETLQAEAKKAFDEYIEQLKLKNEFIKKIVIPQQRLKICHYKNKPVQIPINWRYILSIPFIYGMIVPAVIFHLGVEIYHQICFRLYGIPLVRYQDYFIYDRQLLSWLNLWEKINCYYCSYVNNLIRYSAEISGRTERYWCPIKYFRRISNSHSQYQKFITKKEVKHLRQDWEELRKFDDLD